MRRFYNKGAKGLSGGQVKLDKMGNNDGKISGEDFAVMRSRKMGGGMMKRPMYKEGSPKFKTQLRRYTPEESKELMKDPSRKARIKKLLGKKKTEVKPKKKIESKKIPITKEKLKTEYRKMGFGDMMDSGEIDFSKYKKGGRVGLKAGSGKDTHVTKDGRTVKKGLYYYMNRAKKKGTSKPGKGTVTDKALKASAKTAKKPTKKA